VLGFAGVAAIAFNAYSEGSIEPDFMLFSSSLGGFLFLYVAFFGALPWGAPSDRDGGKEEMSKTKWQMFWAAVVVFLVIVTSFLSSKGVFEEADLVVLVIVGLLFALVGVALYLFIRDRPEDLG
jgi:cell division protein FtsW (lipid II flippase)